MSGDKILSFYKPPPEGGEENEEAAYKFLKIVPNPDGSLTRLNHIPVSPSNPSDPNLPLSKDIPLTPSAATFIRLFRPPPPPSSSPSGAKLPLVMYFHGGGFVFFSAASSVFHDTCVRMAAEFPAVVASVEYRLAPEHRLPAAYEDAADALAWARGQASDTTERDPWMEELVDFSRAFLMGSSAGGNIVYHAALRALDDAVPSPLKIQGLIFNKPYFGGVERTESERRLVNDQIVPLNSSDLMWSLALPEGAGRDHEYSNPLVVAATGGSGVEEKIGRLPRSLVRGYAGDPMVDRQKGFANWLRDHGVSVVPQFLETGHHAAEMFDPAAADALYAAIKDFINDGSDQAK
ncbi:unnamed protein product [Cuscuta campestris]|uniref:Alpha/beta hydrolase fold-3 domain-containing protein n=1 Tax=Cuscuta campestris TaxID=132261 RepID=A0A484LI79_9ASTE|nr:unnamed protein product [Cuscuta campestris]